jgi:predicted N-acetyltransferase YhbS
MRNCVGLAGTADREAVNALRLETYSVAREFRLLRPDLLAWETRDPSCIVLGGWDDDAQLVATIQCRVAGSVAHAESIIGVSVEMPPSCFPGVVMGRAATAPGLTGRGLNSVLRWHCLTAARDAGFRSVLGLAYQGAPRMRTMEAMGYRQVQPARVWDPEVEPLSPPILVYLQLADFDTALDCLWPLAAEGVSASPWQGPTLSLRMAEKVDAS